MTEKNFDQSIVGEKYIVLFDGVCNLCNHAVNFIIDHDPRDQFLFSSLQSDIGRELLINYNLEEGYLDSLVLIKNNKIYCKSAAALHIARHLSGLWPLSYAFIIVPPFIRDFFYDIVARFRYRLFGKQNACRVPTPALRRKFLEV